MKEYRGLWRSSMMGRKEMRADVIQTNPTSTGTDLPQIYSWKTTNGHDDCQTYQQFVDFLDEVNLSDESVLYLLVIH